MKNIGMNTETVKSILEDRKTQFREVLKPIKERGVEFTHFIIKEGFVIAEHEADLRLKMFKQPLPDFIKQEAKYQVGELLSVTEENEICMSDSFEIELFQKDTNIILKVTNVRFEKLWDISEEDCVKEGVYKLVYKGNHIGYSINDNDNISKPSASYQFKKLWNKTALGKYTWEKAPYVFVYEFERANNEK